MCLKGRRKRHAHTKKIIFHNSLYTHSSLPVSEELQEPVTVHSPLLSLEILQFWLCIWTRSRFSQTELAKPKSHARNWTPSFLHVDDSQLIDTIFPHFWFFFLLCEVCHAPLLTSEWRGTTNRDFGLSQMGFYLFCNLFCPALSLSSSCTKCCDS